MQEAYRPPCSHSKSLLFRGESLCENFFSQSEHVSSQIWYQKFSLYWGHPFCEIFFPSLNMYQAISGVKNFSLYWVGGPSGKFFSQSEHVSSQIWCQKFFPLLGPPQTWDQVPPRPETEYPQAWAQVPPWTWNWVSFLPPLPQTWDQVPPLGVDWQTENSTFSHPSDVGGNKTVLLCECKRHTTPHITIARAWYSGEGGSLCKKIFSPVWTCIKPNLVSKIFPFTGEGVPLDIFFPVWTCIKPNLVSKVLPFTGGGPYAKIFFSSLNMYQAKSSVRWQEVGLHIGISTPKR